METEKFKTAFDMLYMPLCMFALRILGNKEDAEDCVQQGFSSLYIAQKEGKDIEELKPYLYRAVRNLAVSKIREYSRMNDFDNEASMRLRCRSKLSTRLNVMPAFGKPSAFFRKNADGCFY